VPVIEGDKKAVCTPWSMMLVTRYMTDESMITDRIINVILFI
jgi:hypothetical protein